MCKCYFVRISQNLQLWLFKFLLEFLSDYLCTFKVEVDGIFLWFFSFYFNYESFIFLFVDFGDVISLYDILADLAILLQFGKDLLRFLVYLWLVFKLFVGISNRDLCIWYEWLVGAVVPHWLPDQIVDFRDALGPLIELLIRSLFDLAFIFEVLQTFGFWHVFNVLLHVYFVC